MVSKFFKRFGIFVALIVLLVLMVFAVVYNFNKLRSDNKSSTNDKALEVEKQYIEEDGKVHGANLSAFLSDDEFFDNDSAIDEDNNAVGNTIQNISLTASSVERDIRIKIVDDEGNPITGEAFAVKVEDTGVYLDEDKNGLIVISDMKPGKYNVTLNEIEGYNVPTSPLSVKVKSTVSYTAIDDISYFLHLESEVDMLAEDTQSKDLDSEDKDDTQYKSLLDLEENKNSAIQLGIDVSKWNGDIDWDVVKAEGVDFAIIRCGYRGSSSGWLIEDPYFYKNLQGAKKAGVKVGIYFFTQATNAVEAVEEASAALALIGDIDIDYPIFIDTEGAGGNGRADNLDVDTRTTVVNAFCKTIQDSGLEAGIYASRNWYLNNLNTDELGGYNIWLAEYRQTPLYEGKYDMWQYTSSGSVSGIEGRVDLNVSYLGIE
jgi:GH25 family lysozyme M1 (1,4-beta-N-acetylmuramidase)